MAPITCTRCSSPNGTQDRYCGSCGCPLAELRWRSSGDRLADGEGHLVVRSSVASGVARLVNRGVGAAAVALHPAAGESLPPWIDAARLPRKAFVVPAGGEAVVEIGLNVTVLQAMFGQRSTEARRGDTADANLRFRTTLTQRSGEGSTPVEILLRVLIARDPWITPAASHYPFVAWERLRGAGVEHTIEFHNEAAETIRVHRVEVTSGSGALGSPEQRTDAAALLMVDPVQVPFDINPGDAREVRLQIRSGGPTGKESPAGWFSGLVKFHYSTGPGGDRREVASALIDGYLGKAPCVVFEDGAASRTLPLSSPPEKPVELSLHNPGSIPVSLRAVGVFHEVGGILLPARQDWLTVQGAEADSTLPAGGTLKLKLTVRSDQRSDEESVQSVCSRVLRISHDGWSPDGPGVAELKVEVKFPIVEEPDIWLGVDFGTSSSMVCVLRGEEATALILEPELRSEQLASLMYYDGSRKAKGAADTFLLGAAAKNSASINPANLVRSIKSIVSRAPDTMFHFEGSNPAEGFQKYSTQQLLDQFISALRSRGEKSIHLLPSSVRQQLFPTGDNVRFRQAVFTHPVEVSGAMKQALHGAARAARLDSWGVDAVQFIANSCIDEATAAVLAYVFLRAYKKLKVESRVDGDVERVLCFDVGGGTTDVAAVEVVGLNGFETGAVDHIAVSLHATAGDSRFGGDDLDRFLSLDLLRQVFKPGEAASTAALADYESALDSRSLADFKASFRPPAGADTDLAYRIYRKVAEVRNKAEEAKRKLGLERSVEVTLDGADWPHRKKSEKDGQQLKLTLAQQTFVQHVRGEASARCSLLDQVVRNAAWQWSDVTTLLFTGQGTRVPMIRETVLKYLAEKRGELPIPIVVEPDNPAFDPKRCVALGAAVWGSSGETGWIKVNNRISAQLTFELQRVGPRFDAILPVGTPLPAKVTLSFNSARRQVDIFKSRSPFLRFTWPTPTLSVELEVRGPADYWVFANDQYYPGVLL